MKKMVKKPNWSPVIFWLTSAMMPVQSRSSSQPNQGLIHPSGTTSGVWARAVIAMTATTTAEIVMIVNCRTSASTIDRMPPRMV